MFEELAPIDRLVARARQLAALQALLFKDLVAVARATPVPEFAAMEVSAVLTWTRQAATSQLELAHDLVVRVPAVHDALAHGDIDLPKAKVLVEGVGALDIPDAREVCDRVLPEAPRLTTGQLRARLAKLVIEVDAEAAAKQHHHRVAGRRLVLQAEADSCAGLSIYEVSASDAVAAANHVHALARSFKQAGDPRTMDQLRADTAIDLLCGRVVGTSAVSSRPGVEIVASLETLTSLAETPGQLQGYGPVIAEITREVARRQHRARWTFTVRDSDSGTVHTGVIRRRPTAEVAREVRQRDRTCRFPGCRISASRCDLDHTVAVENGGLTVPGNLGPTCRYHHRGKPEGGWMVVQPEPGHFHWRSPLGRTYQIKPEPP